MMRSLVRSKSVKSWVSGTISVALILSVLVLPAFAVPTPSTPANANFGTTALTSVDGSSSVGLLGTVSMVVTGTQAIEAQQESAFAYQTATSTVAPLSSLNVTSTTGDYALHIKVLSERAHVDSPTAPFILDTLGNPAAEKDMVISLATTSTISGVLDAINAAFNAPLDPNDVPQLKDDFMVRASFNSVGRIRIQKLFAEAGGEIWAEDNVLSSSGANGVADAVFGGNNEFGRGSGPTGSYLIGQTPSGYSVEATFTPTYGDPYAMHTAVVGSFINGSPSFDSFQSVVDTQSGQFTGVELQDTNYRFFAPTAGRFSALLPGTFTFDLVNGIRDPQGSAGAFAQTTAKAGQTDTMTVAINPGAADTYGGKENAINGVRITLPAGFGGAFNTTATAAPGSQSVVATSGGTQVLATNFVAPATVPFDVQLSSVNPTQSVYTKSGNTTTSPTASKAYPVKIEIRNVGTGLDKWIELPTQYLNVTSNDVITSLNANTRENRAGGRTRIITKLIDTFGNEIVEFPHAIKYTVTAGGGSLYEESSLGSTTDTTHTMVISPAAPGMGPYNKVAWILGDVEGTNTVRVMEDTSAVSPPFVDVLVNTTGIGAPTKVVVLPGGGKTAFDLGETPTFYLAMQDANGRFTSFLRKFDPQFRRFTVEMNSLRADPNDPPLVRTVDIQPDWAFSNFLFPQLDSGNFDFGPSNFVDTWNITAQSTFGRVAPSPVLTVSFGNIALAGVPFRLKMTVTPPPAGDQEIIPAHSPAFSPSMDIYNNRQSYGLDKSAFGMARGDGSDGVTITAQVVDNAGVATAVAGIDVTMTIPVIHKGVFPEGHIFHALTDANGQVSVVMKSNKQSDYESNIVDLVNSGNGFNGGIGRSWFEPVRVTDNIGDKYGVNGGHGFDDYAFAYFFRGQLKTLTADKPWVAADGADKATVTAHVEEPAFGTPVANWALHFTNTFGSMTSAESSAPAAAIDSVTGADGNAAVMVSSDKVGSTNVAALDQDGTRLFTTVHFTDLKMVATVLPGESPKQGGDTAMAAVRLSFTDLAGAPVYFDSNNWDANDANVVAPDVLDVNGNPVSTNDADVSKVETTTVNGKTVGAALIYQVPAKDIYGNHLESAGLRRAIFGGDEDPFVTLRRFNGLIFFDEQSTGLMTTADVTFFNHATFTGHAAQLFNTVSAKGAGFAINESDGDIPLTARPVEVFVGKITSGDMFSVGTMWVARDGSLQPQGTWNAAMIRALAPGDYDITFDGLVFPGAFKVTPLFTAPSITGPTILDPKKSYSMAVDALGHSSVDVYVDGVKIISSGATSMFTLNTTNLSAGKHTVTAHVFWNNGLMVASAISGSGYDEVITKDIVVLKGPLPTPTAARTTRTVIRVAGSSVANVGTVKVIAYRLKGGVWSAFYTKTVKVGADGKYATACVVPLGFSWKFRATTTDSTGWSAYSNTVSVK